MKPIIQIAIQVKMYLPTIKVPSADYIQLSDPHNPEETVHVSIHNSVNTLGSYISNNYKKSSCLAFCMEK
jgi:hypothetical protein